MTALSREQIEDWRHYILDSLKGSSWVMNDEINALCDLALGALSHQPAMERIRKADKGIATAAKAFAMCISQNVCYDGFLPSDMAKWYNELVEGLAALRTLAAEATGREEDQGENHG